MIVLASGSPRRQELLKKYGIDFEVIVTDADESAGESLTPEDYVREVSRRKAEAAVDICVGGGRGDSVIVAADTIVSVDGSILGKPANDADAFSMLRLLAGNRHIVCTGICVAFIKDGDIAYTQDCCTTDVWFKPLTDKQIEEYIGTGEPFGKAGAYAIQGIGGGLVEKIEGDYENVVGLSVGRLIEILKENAVSL